MMPVLSLAFKSLRNRKFNVGLTIASIALSVTLLLGVERIRREAQTGFTNTISGTDLIVGARNSPVQLLLSSVFGLSDATNTISWKSYEAIADHLLVPWVGACIHTPPPPPNQIVFVQTAEGIDNHGQFTPVWVSGVMAVKAATKDLFLIDGSKGIDVGYRLTEARVEPYKP